MKLLKNIFRTALILLVIISCDDDRDLDFLDNVVVPSNVAATYNVTQDNTGMVTITPTADGGSAFEVFYGDGTNEFASLSPGESTERIYAEGVYDVRIVAYNIKGESTEATQQLVVSFQAPNNLVVTIENDISISKRVNVTVTADFATMYDFYTGDPANTDPISANIGETISYDYPNPGTYAVRVVAKGAAIQTTEYTEDFEVTEILAPTAGAPAPTGVVQANAISLFSDAFTDVPVDTWNTGWSDATFEDVDIDNNPTKKYTALNFNGIETVTTPVDASGMEFLHLDVWTPNITAFRIKLVDFLGDGFGGGNGDTEAELTFTPTLGEWVSLDIPLADFTAGGMTSFSDLNQYIISGDPSGQGIIFIDNVYFYGSNNPAEAAPTPTLAASDVISMFSDAYTDVPVDTWNTGWSAATFEDVMVAGNPTKKYTDLNFNGIETVGTPIDASGAGMTHFHMDIWTPNMTAFRVKLVDFLGDGFGGGNGDTEAELSFTPTQGGWMSLDIPLADFAAAGMTGFSDISQFIISGDPSGSGTIFIDNVYYYRQGGVTTQLIEDFEGTPPTFTVFGNIAATEVVANPDMSGANTTANVAKLTKSNGSEVWAGTFFEVGTPLDLANFDKISVKTWSPKLGAVVKLKLENADASITHEVDLNTTVANAWEELVYDFSGAPAASYTRVVIFFDFGNPGDDSLYYYDEINLINNSGGGPAPLVFETFEGTAPTFTVFGNIAATEVIANPDATGVNTSANVAKLTKSNGSEVWAGTFFEVTTPLDLTTYSKISVKTWSPKLGAVVKVKIENADASITHEVDLNSTVANAWEELVYDFSGAPAATYTRVVIFFDFGNPGDDSLYYFDDYTLKN